MGPFTCLGQQVLVLWRREHTGDEACVHVVSFSVHERRVVPANLVSSAVEVKQEGCTLSVRLMSRPVWNKTQERETAEWKTWEGRQSLQSTLERVQKSTHTREYR